MVELRQANPLTSFVGGMEQADLAAQYGQRRQLNALLPQYGEAAMQGDTAALNALLGAGIPGLEAANALHGLYTDRRVMDQTDRRLGQTDEELRMEAERLRVEAAEAARQAAAEGRAEEVEREQAAIRRFGATGMVARQNGQLDAWRMHPDTIALAQELEIDPATITEESFDGIMTGLVAAHDGMAEGIQSAVGLTARSQSWETFEGPDGQEYYFDPANPGAGAQPIGGQAMPQGEGQSSAEAKLARIMETVNPNTGQPFTRDEAIVLTEFLEVARDPMTDNLALIDRRTGRVWNGTGVAAATAPAAPVAAAPASGAGPDLSFGSQFQQDPTSAFGLTGAARGFANTVGDALPGVPAPFPETMEASNDLLVWREGLLSQMAAAYGGRPPVWALERLYELIPESGRITVGPDQAQSQLRALVRQFQSEATTLRMIANDQTRTVEERRNARAQAAANDAAAASTERLLGAFSNGDVQLRPEVVNRLGAYE